MEVPGSGCSMFTPRILKILFFCLIFFVSLTFFTRIPQQESPSGLLMNYHFIHHRGPYNNHKWAESWIGPHGLNISFWTELGPDPKLPNVYRVDSNDMVKYHRGLEVFAIWRNSSWVERGDYVRYLALAVEGGVYSDTDVELIVPVNEWLSRFEVNDVSIHDLDFLLGLEFDRPARHQGNEPLPFQVCQWVLYSAKGGFLMNSIIQFIEDTMKALPPAATQDQVLWRTGPVAFTKGIIQLIKTYGVPPGGEERKYPFAMAAFKDTNHGATIVTLQVPDGNGKKKFIQGAFLGIQAFNSLTPNPNPRILVKHHFSGEWRAKGGKVNTTE